MNPCRCGWYGTGRCTCKPGQVQQYLRRLSGPLMDRIDIQVAVEPVTYEALSGRSSTREESSASMRAKVDAARKRQLERLPDEGERSFADGFRLGAKLMLEVFRAE